MEHDLRFDSKGRVSRMVQAFITAILAAVVAAIGLLGIALVTLFSGHPGVSVPKALRGFVDGLIATWWYGYEILIINWKD